jgi:hypothetical protein
MYYFGNDVSDHDAAEKLYNSLEEFLQQGPKGGANELKEIPELLNQVIEIRQEKGYEREDHNEENPTRRRRESPCERILSLLATIVGQKSKILPMYQNN